MVRLANTAKDCLNPKLLLDDIGKFLQSSTTKTSVNTKGNCKLIEINTNTIQVTPELLSLISEIDQFKVAWRHSMNTVVSRLQDWKRLATIESIGSSTRIEGSQMTDQEVEELLTELKIREFASRDEQDLAGFVRSLYFWICWEVMF